MPPRSNATERNVQDAIVARLRVHGWMVRELSQPQAVRGELVGMPDVIAFKDGHTLLVEVKRPGGKVRDSQRQFALELDEHAAPTLVHWITSDIDNFARALNYHESMAGIVTVREE
jgi:Holliday junction resolvase